MPPGQSASPPRRSLLERDLGELEGAFRQHHLREDVRSASRAITVYGLFLLAFAPLDFGFAEGWKLALLLGTRAVVAAILVVAIFAFRRLHDARTFDRLFFLMQMLAVVTAFAVNLGRPADYVQFTTLDVVLVFGLYTMVLIPTWMRLLACLMVSFGDVFLLAVVKETPSDLALSAAVLGLVAANALGLLTSSRVQSYRRQQYLAGLELERLASRDDLTGALNRRAFLDRAEEAFRRARVFGEPLTVALIDLDHFKAVNDEHGHLVGDDALSAFGRLVDGIRRDTDVFGRLGGEEFAMLLPGTDLAGGGVVGERIREMTAMSHARAGGPPVALSVSIGVVELAPADEILESLLLRADDALYAAKAGGRDRVVAALPTAPSRLGLAGIDPVTPQPRAIADLLRTRPPAE